MNTDTKTERRLNPFAFPAETNVRFILLIVSGLMLMLSMGVTLGSSIPAYSDAGLLGAIWLSACSVSLIVLLIGLTLVIYFTYPARIRLQKHLRPFAREADPIFADAVSNLAALARVSPVPAIELGPDVKSLDGQAFGFLGRPVLRLGGGLRLLLRKASDKFRAIVLHELAHIANQDVERTYFALALWSAILIVFIPSDIATAVLRGVLPAAQGLGGTLTALQPFLPLLICLLGAIRFVLVALEFGIALVIVLNIRNSILRFREFYADWRAVQWGAEASLKSILEQNIDKEKMGFWTRLWRLHPTPRERLAMLQDPTALFRVSPGLGFMIGFLLAYFFTGCYELMLRLGVIIFSSLPSNQFGVLASVSSPPLAFRLGLLILFAAASAIALYFFAASVGLQVQRDAIVDLARGRSDPGGYLLLGLSSLLVAVGFEVGVWFIPDNHLRNITPGFVWLPVWWLGVTGLTWLALVYTRFFAKRLVGSHLGAAPPDRSRQVLTLALTGLMFSLYLPAAIGREMVVDPPPNNAGLLIALATILFLDAVVLYPVAFGATWVAIEFVRRISRPACPTCGQPFRDQYTVGKSCEHCGNDLAPWLFADPPAVT